MFSLIRKTRDVLLAITAIIVTIAGGASYFSPLFFGQPATDRDWLVLHFFDGRVRLFWLHSEDEPITVAQPGGRPMLDVGPGRPRSLQPSRTVQSADEASRRTSWMGRIRIGTRMDVKPFGGRLRWPLRVYNPSGRGAKTNTQSAAAGTASRVFINFVRVPMWVPALVILIPPLMTVIRGPLLQRCRRKGGLCAECGYDLTGLTGRRCPECGTLI